MSQANWPALKNNREKPDFFRALRVPKISKMANLNGRNFLLVTGHMLTGRCQNFVHLVTGHTLGRIERNGTVAVSYIMM